ncbi:Uncharacterised protein [Vibrio cholerae]|nr:Uncharacterised protein [Vibrio cholerae]
MLLCAAKTNSQMIFAPISPGYLSCVMPKSSSTVSKWKLPCVVIKKVCCHLSLVH